VIASPGSADAVGANTIIAAAPSAAGHNVLPVGVRTISMFLLGRHKCYTVGANKNSCGFLNNPRWFKRHQTLTVDHSVARRNAQSNWSDHLTTWPFAGIT
jgi:hypothetical protein